MGSVTRRTLTTRAVLRLTRARPTLLPATLIPPATPPALALRPTTRPRAFLTFLPRVRVAWLFYLSRRRARRYGREFRFLGFWLCADSFAYFR